MQSTPYGRLLFIDPGWSLESAERTSTQVTCRANRKKCLTVPYIVEHPNQEGDTCIDWTSQYCWTNGWNCLWRGHSVYRNRPLIPQGKGKGRGEGQLGQGGRGRSQGGETPMGTTAYGGKGSKGRAANGDRPVGAASCRRDHHTNGVMPKPPPFFQHKRNLRSQLSIYCSCPTLTGKCRAPGILSRRTGPSDTESTDSDDPNSCASASTCSCSKEGSRD